MHYFPLGTNDRKSADTLARKLIRSAANKGWNELITSHSREVTIAVFWLHSPVACTYATIYTLLEDGAADAPQPLTSLSSDPVRVAVVEPESGVRRAMEAWVARNSGYSCVASHSKWSADIPQGVQIVLANRNLPELAGDEQLASLRARHPSTAIFPFGIYAESDYIFHSVSGVNRGYFFRRRLPAELFQPLGIPAPAAQFNPGRASATIHSYFQNLFDPTPVSEPSMERINLTPRENDILQCLSKGLKDKEIASALKLSVWTVHGHVKNVFEKMRVHSRTEAVVKYLQK